MPAQWVFTEELRMHIYMKVDKITGSVTDSKYKGWIELESFNLGVNCTSKMVTGKMSDRQFSLPEFLAPCFTKKIDQSSGALFDCATSGKVISQVTIEITGDKSDCLQYTLSEVMITSRNIEAFNGAGVMESGTLSYTKISESYTHTNSDGRSQTPFTAGYDLKEAKKL